MKFRTVLTAMYVSFLTFSILSLFFGATGIASMEKLNDRKRAVSANMEDLDSRHEDLLAVLSSLRSDPEAIIIEARSLGLFRTGDNVAYMQNPGLPRNRYDAGSVLRLNPLKYKEEGFLRISALAAGILIILASLISWRINDAHQAK